MRSIERKFNNVQEKNQLWSSYLCFANTIKGNNFSEDRLKRMFTKLVDKNDYAQNEKRQIIRHLLFLNNPANRTGNVGKFVGSRV